MSIFLYPAFLLIVSLFVEQLQYSFSQVILNKQESITLKILSGCVQQQQKKKKDFNTDSITATLKKPQPKQTNKKTSKKKQPPKLVLIFI